MSDGSETRSAWVYPTTQQYERWEARADALDMSVSAFIKSMTEAGMKKFDATVKPDETNRELRDQRNDLKAELDRARERIDELEGRLMDDERATIEDHVEKNPGTSFQNIVTHVRDTAPERVNRHLDAMEGETVAVVNGHYEPKNIDEKEA